MRINLPLYKPAREIVALLAIVELVLASYIGYRFGEGATSQAWLFVGILAIIAYISTRLWIWVMETLVRRSNNGKR